MITKKSCIEALENYPDLMTTKEVAEVFRVGETTVKREMWAGKLEVMRFGVQVRVPKKSLIKYIIENSGEQK